MTAELRRSQSAATVLRAGILQDVSP